MRDHPRGVGFQRVLKLCQRVGVLVELQEQIAALGIDVGPRDVGEAVVCVIGELELADGPGGAGQEKIVVRR